MARVPKITSPCPLRWAGPPQPGMDFCGQCQRRVHNLDLMSESQRAAFLTGCSGDVCVSYTVRRAPIAAGLGLAMVVAIPTNATDVPAVVVMADSRYCPDQSYMTAGGIQAAEKLQWIDESEVSRPEKPELPDIQASTWLPTPQD